MEKIKMFFKIMFKPTYWLMNDSYSKQVDSLLNDLMDKHNFKNISKHTAEIGGYEFWVANHPYGSFTLYPGRAARPSRSTIMKAQEKLIGDHIKEICTQ